MNHSRILIVEDESIIAMEIEAKLKAMGYQLAGTARSGENALDLVNRERPDLVLMDIRLKGAMDGIDAAEKILQQFNIPVIFLTAYSEESTLERAKRAKPFGYLLKPFDDKQIKSAIEIAMYKHQAEQEILRMNRLYDVLSQVNQSVVRIRNREELLSTICRLVVERGEIDLAWIGWIDDETLEIRPVAHFGENIRILSQSRFFADDRTENPRSYGKTIRENKPFICNSCRQEGCPYPSESSPGAFGFQSCGAFPLRFRGKVCGTLNLCTVAPGFFRDREINLLEEVALDISFALDKIADDARRERLETELISERAFLRTLLNTIPDMIWMKDPHGAYLTCNPAFERFIGVKEADLIGKTDYDFFPQELADFFRGHDRNAASAGKATKNEEWVTMAEDGSRILLETIKVPMQDTSGEFKGVLGIARDVTIARQSLNALVESEERIQLFIDFAPAALAMFDREMRYLNASRRWLSDYRLENKRLFGVSHYEIFPEITDEWKSIHQRALNGEILISAKDRFVRANGSVQWLSWEVRPWHDHSGEIAGIVIFSEDITERVKAEDRFSTVFHNSPVAIGISRLADNRLVDVNESFLRLFEYENEPVIGLTSIELNQWAEPLDRSRLVGMMLGEGRVQLFPAKLRKKSGKIFDAMISMELVELSGEKHLLGFIADFSHQKQIEDELRQRLELQAQFEKIAASVPGLVYSFKLRPDGSACMPFSTPKAADLFGISQAVLADDISPLIANIHPEDIRRVRDNFSESMRNPNKPWHDAYRYQHPLNGLRWIEGWSIPQIENDGTFIWHGFLMDITDRRQSDEEKAGLEAQLHQAQKMESIGRLAGGVAHDFNNMLGIILGHAELAMDDMDPSSPFFADLDEIRKAAGRSANLTRQLLAFARKQTISPKVMDMNETVEGMLKMLRRLIGEDIALSWIPGANLWNVHMDPTQVDQILANLCVNARDAISGVGKMSIETRNATFNERDFSSSEGLSPGDYVMLAVTDSGTGMDNDTLQHIFEPFFTTKEQGKGTGLGLATVYGIIRQNSGFITVESKPEQGTTFRIYLPRHSSKDEAARLSSPDAPPPRGNETVLVVEDEPAILKMTTLMLKKLGYTVLTSSKPTDAIRLAKSHAGRIDLIMTDVIMPDMNGKDLFGHLQSLFPDIQCLFMSGYTANVIAHHGVLDPGIHFIQKPFSIHTLAKNIRSVIECRGES